MNYTLKPELEQFVQREIRSGKYTTPDEVIFEALRLLERRNQYNLWVEEIGQKIDVAVAQLDRGEGVDGEVAIARFRDKFLKVREAQ